MPLQDAIKAGYGIYYMCERIRNLLLECFHLCLLVGYSVVGWSVCSKRAGIYTSMLLSEHKKFEFKKKLTQKVTILKLRFIHLYIKMKSSPLASKQLRIIKIIESQQKLEKLILTKSLPVHFHQFFLLYSHWTINAHTTLKRSSSFILYKNEAYIQNCLKFV